MKKVFAIIVAVALMVALLPLSTAVFAAQDADSITKSFDEETYELCEVVTGTIEVEAGVDSDGEGLVVEDIFPAGLTLLDAEIDSGGAGDVDIDEETNTLTVTLDDDDTTYVITFEALVTYARADEDIEVTNTATVYDGGYDFENRLYGESDDATLTVEAYEGFEKVLVSGDDPVPTRSYEAYEIEVNIDNDLPGGIDMEDVVVVDNLPGNVKYLDWTVEEGSVDVTLTGKTEKAHLMWDLEGDLDNGDDVDSTLEVATDTVGGKDGDKHQLKKAGKYTLNPGATLMFTDSEYSCTCMVDSAAVRVDVDKDAVG
jgi:fimbrial isopeptide formation D2 family protein